MLDPLYICSHKRKDSFLCKDCLHKDAHPKKYFEGLDICNEINHCVVTGDKECICIPVASKGDSQYTLI